MGGGVDSDSDSIVLMEHSPEADRVDRYLQARVCLALEGIERNLWGLYWLAFIFGLIVVVNEFFRGDE